MTIGLKVQYLGPITRSITLAVLLVASPVMGMVYMWKDSKGTAHYTNKEYEIPDRYRFRAKAIYPEAGDSGKPQTGSNVQAQPSIPTLNNQQVNPVEAPSGIAQQARPDVQHIIQPPLPVNTPKHLAPKTPAKRVRLPRAASEGE